MAQNRRSRVWLRNLRCDPSISAFNLSHLMCQYININVYPLLQCQSEYMNLFTISNERNTYLLIVVVESFSSANMILKLHKHSGDDRNFIRCIKPNASQLPNIFEQELVLQQLRCCGVLEVVRISRSGYPTRHSHDEFASR
jgi:hypothetical protein